MPPGGLLPRRSHGEPPDGNLRVSVVVYISEPVVGGCFEHLGIDELGGEEIKIAHAKVIFGVEAGISDKQEESRFFRPIRTGLGDEILQSVRGFFSVIEFVVDIVNIHEEDGVPFGLLLSLEGLQAAEEIGVGNDDDIGAVDLFVPGGWIVGLDSGGGSESGYRRR